jgi:hypothetical protein
MILGGGALLTGFFGMNFGGAFQKAVFEPPGAGFSAYWEAVIVAALVAFGALLFGVFLIVINWQDYKDTLVPRLRQPARALLSVKRIE